MVTILQCLLCDLQRSGPAEAAAAAATEVADDSIAPNKWEQCCAAYSKVAGYADTCSHGEHLLLELNNCSQLRKVLEKAGKALPPALKRDA